MSFQDESFPYPDKKGTPEEVRRIQRPKGCVTTNNNKDEDKCLKNNTQNIKQFWNGGRVDLGALAMKGYSAFPKALALLESQYQILLCYIQDTRWWDLTPR